MVIHRMVLLAPLWLETFPFPQVVDVPQHVTPVMHRELHVEAQHVVEVDNGGNKDAEAACVNVSRVVWDEEDTYRDLQLGLNPCRWNLVDLVVELVDTVVDTVDTATSFVLKQKAT